MFCYYPADIKNIGPLKNGDFILFAAGEEMHAALYLNRGMDALLVNFSSFDKSKENGFVIDKFRQSSWRQMIRIPHARIVPSVAPVDLISRRPNDFKTIPVICLSAQGLVVYARLGDDDLAINLESGSIHSGDTASHIHSRKWRIEYPEGDRAYNVLCAFDA